ncbi:MAG: DsrE family protein [Syntrophobacterales bacterium]|jgi:predicted peroxiredoxin
MKNFKYWKRLIVVLFIVVSLFGSAAAQGDVKGMFIVVTSPDPQTQMMAMVLATQIAMKGKKSQVLLCGFAGDLALKESTEVILKPNNKSPQMLMKNLIKLGVTVEVCALYLPNKGKAMADLVPGVSPAKPPAIAEALLEPGVKLFTF